METKKKYSWEYLDNCSYRALQQIAKSLYLPCNFKKIYLKELILAKNVKTEKELNERINYIKLERKNQAGRKTTSRRKTSSEKSNLKDKQKPKNQNKSMLSPSITVTPKRTYIPRRSSPRFKNLFIRYRPKSLIGRSASPKTYSSPRNKNKVQKKIKHEQDERKIKKEQICEINNTNDYNLNNDITPIVIQKEFNPVEEDLVNIYEVIPPPIKTRIMNIIYPSTSQGSYFEEHIKNVSNIRELVSANQSNEVYPKIENNSMLNENTPGFMDRINNYINRFTHTTQNEFDTTGEENIKKTNLPKFADAFANICNLPWVTQMQENDQKEKNQLCMDNIQETISDFPDEFGFQNLYNNTEENNEAMQLLESYLDSPEDDVQNVLEDFETVQCVICSRSGTKNLLEGHIKEKHPTRIHKDCGGEWMLKYNLGHLTCLQIWCSEVLQQDTLLYLLSVKYQDPDYCMATLSILSTKPLIKKYGSITLYNSLTGEPHTWEGQLEPFSTNLPYYNENKGLKIKLEKLNLLPNSANLKLINRELVNSSLSKVIVGQPELNIINLMFFVS
ncbi:PREDICTED: uncharacterized protein LOC106115243, partial [Papilio xuthus]|uniref:Uncharacterized protein LOC106115243 n=1 Tax=Papilio xuthus TaxID=66420 RepID=A0AAJ6Z2B1_PAPXU